MIPFKTVCETVPGLTEAALRDFLAQDFVRPDQRAGEPVFRDIDVARIRLIVELHTELEVETPTLPLVLSLLDQLYATRRAMRQLIDALEPPAREAVAARMKGSALF